PHAALATRCQKTRRGPSSVGIHRPRLVTTSSPPPSTPATAITFSPGVSSPGKSAGSPPPIRRFSQPMSVPSGRGLLAQRLAVLLQRHEVAEQRTVVVGRLDRRKSLQLRLDLADLPADEAF